MEEERSERIKQRGVGQTGTNLGIVSEDAMVPTCWAAGMLGHWSRWGRYGASTLTAVLRLGPDWALWSLSWLVVDAAVCSLQVVQRPNVWSASCLLVC